VHVLVANAGSSSLKLSLLDGDDAELWRSDLDGPDDAAAADLPDEVDAVGHRIVHGGHRFTSAARLDPTVVGALEELTELAPLHQPRSLAAVESLSRALPDVPQVACFDTAFHASIPPAAATYALPREWRERFGLRRFGFHGLSHAYASRRAGELSPGARRIVSCHLGAGASLCAVLDGRSVDTTMGFTPLEGLVMATRSGSVDPGLLLWLQERAGLGAERMTEALEHESGLVGLAGTADMRELLARDDADARLALDVYVHRLRTGIGAMAASLAGLDALVFTGGVGESAPRVRVLACAGLEHLGVALDAERNAAAEGADADVVAQGSRVAVVVVRAREDIEIARQTRALLD